MGMGSLLGLGFGLGFSVFGKYYSKLHVPDNTVFLFNVPYCLLKSKVISVYGVAGVITGFR